jgi:hypothetical protein
MRVYQPQGVSVSWKFQTLWGEIISGRAEKGRVMLATEADILKIYLICEDMEIGCPPLELTDELATFCGIKDIEGMRLLTHILVQRDTRRIEQDLKRREIPDNVSADTVRVSEVDSGKFYPVPIVGLK